MKPRQKLFYKIGEVCQICEIEPHVLRYWETVFSRLKPVKNRAGQRIYRRADVELIERIKGLLYQEGYTVAGAQTKLAEEARGDLPLFQDTQLARQRRALGEIKQALSEIEAILERKKRN